MGITWHHRSAKHSFEVGCSNEWVGRSEQTFKYFITCRFRLADSSGGFAALPLFVLASWASAPLASPAEARFLLRVAESAELSSAAPALLMMPVSVPLASLARGSLYSAVLSGGSNTNDAELESYR